MWTLLSTVDVDPEIPAWYDRWWGLMLLISVLLYALWLLCGIIIARKAGYSGWWGAIAVLVPILGPVILVIFALAKWPALTERDEAVELLEERGISLPSKADAARKKETEQAEIDAEARRRVDAARADQAAAAEVTDGTDSK